MDFKCTFEYFLNNPGLVLITLYRILCNVNNMNLKIEKLALILKNYPPPPPQLPLKYFKQKINLLVRGRCNMCEPQSIWIL